MNKYKMSSVVSSVASPAHGARFFVAVASSSNTYTADATAGTAQGVGTIVRDMGKTIRVPGASGVTGTSQRILRKVSKITRGAQTPVTANVPVSSFVGFSQGGEDTTTVFYIDLYDAEWASLSA